MAKTKWDLLPAEKRNALKERGATKALYNRWESFTPYAKTKYNKQAAVQGYGSGLEKYILTDAARKLGARPKSQRRTDIVRAMVSLEKPKWTMARRSIKHLLRPITPRDWARLAGSG